MKPSEVIPTLKKHVLVDGFHVVVDTKKSNGSWVVDADSGKKYLDCYSQFASQPLGWNHPKLVAAKDRLGEAALHKVANSDMYCEEYAKFTEAFSKITPDFEHYFFISGGALAVENALKAAFDWKCKKNSVAEDSGVNFLNVIHFKNAFHGRSGYTMSITNTDPTKTALYPKFSWTKITNPKTHNPFDETKVKHLEELALMELDAAAKRSIVAAIIVEPIQGEGGDNHFRKEFFKELRDRADKYEALLIFDEVQTGLGLTGKMWAYEHFGVVPDIMCFGKKTQVCGIASTDRIDNASSNIFTVSGRVNSTWGGNIVDMVRAQVIFEAIQEENLVDNAREVGEFFKNGLQDLGLENVRGRGLMIAFDLKDGAERNKTMSRMQENMLVLASGRKSIRFRPPLTFSKPEAEQAIDFVKKAI